MPGVAQLASDVGPGGVDCCIHEESEQLEGLRRRKKTKER